MTPRHGFDTTPTTYDAAAIAEFNRRNKRARDTYQREQHYQDTRADEQRRYRARVKGRAK